MPNRAVVSRIMVQLADTLNSDFDVVETLDIMVRRCVDTLGFAAA